MVLSTASLDIRRGERNQREDNRAENSREPIFKPERNLRSSNSPGLAQRMVESHTGSQPINLWSMAVLPTPPIAQLAIIGIFL